MAKEITHMRREILEIPDAVEQLLSRGGEATVKAARQAQNLDPRMLLSVARGSSDHACTYLKYAAELILGRPMASVGPSVGSVYGARLEAAGALCLSISQSGQSPDIVRMTESLGEAEAMTVAITNDGNSRLAEVADVTLPIHAGVEKSVAATKTFVASLIAGLWLIAEIGDDKALTQAIHKLPRQLDAATNCDWSVAVKAVKGHSSIFTLGRGPSWAIACEAALKLKEVCRIHAESYSSAEVLHGPVSIVENGFPIIAFAGADAAEKGLAETADSLVAKGARVFATTGMLKSAECLPHERTDHWLTDPVAAIVPFYGMVEELALQQNIDPDAPRHLRKVTKTV